MASKMHLLGSVLLLFCIACSKEAPIARVEPSAPVEPAEQIVVRETIEKEHKGDAVQWLQWWPAIDTKTAGLTEYLQEQNAKWKPVLLEGKSDFKILQSIKEIEEANPEKMIRVRYRVADEKGLPELHDEVHFLSGDTDKARRLINRPIILPSEKDFQIFAEKLFPM